MEAYNNLVSEYKTNALSMFSMVRENVWAVVEEDKALKITNRMDG